MDSNDDQNSSKASLTFATSTTEEDVIIDKFSSLSLLQQHQQSSVDVSFVTPVKSSFTTDDSTRSSPFPSTYVKATPNSFLSPPTKRLPPEVIQQMLLDNEQRLQKGILLSAKKVAHTITSPKVVWDTHAELFRFCNSSSLSTGNAKKMKRLLNKRPDLLYVRTSIIDGVPDGYSPLHVAALRNNVQAATILLEIHKQQQQTENGGRSVAHGLKSKGGDESSLLTVVDFLGQNPLHVASSQGHIEMITFLTNQWMEEFETLPSGIDAPRDIGGMTPIAHAYISSAVKKETLQKIEQELLKPGDWSICPPTPSTSCTKKMKNSSPTINKHDPKRQLNVTFSKASMAGRRGTMEDAISIVYPLLPHNTANDMQASSNLVFFGVFDGHGDGGIMSQFVADQIPQLLVATDEWQQATHSGMRSCSKSIITNPNVIERALIQACLQVDEKMRKELGNTVAGGSTGIMAVMTPTHIVVGNVGDSRAILVKKPPVDYSNDKSLFQVIQLSQDHKPNLETERRRIEEAGLQVDEIDFHGTKYYKVCSCGSYRIELATSRTFGDYDFKSSAVQASPELQAVIAVPEIVIYERNMLDDWFLILACDGIWDVMTNEECAKFVIEHGQRSEVAEEEELENTCLSLIDTCFARGSDDNMSVIIASIGAVPSGGTQLFPSN